ncbi:MAG: DsbA family protein [Patescibacteria group bacterium]|nr:DsbA family protein [Patescibacteria group bacterium]
MQEKDIQKYFLLGTVALVVLAIVGIVVAIVSGPSASIRPRGERVEGLSFSDDNDPARGPGESKYVVRIFSDFQCPACKDAEAGTRYAMDKYGDRVRFVWNDYPLSSIHQNSRMAALAARCAEDQGKFWEYHDKLFDLQSQWEDNPAPFNLFVDYAKLMKLDEQKFGGCLAGEQFLRKVQADEAEAERNRVEGTPTFFLGDLKIVGGMDEAGWKQELDSLLNRS